ncbi:MAG: DUF3530 family protein [Gammaproteobacteria bacterium]|nr:MAG: DUF3530 family protein [Gammaproteobacteria bacterium]
MHLDKAMKTTMLILNRFLCKPLALLLMTCFFCQSCLSLAQNPPKADEASASSAGSSPPPEKLIYLNSSERDNDLLAKALTAVAKADELLWLETPDEKLLALYKAGETRKTLGVLLIMHSPEAPQLWPANLESLRRHLPLYSWATIALPLPAKYSPVSPSRDPLPVTPQALEESSASSSEAAAPAVAPVEASKPVLARDKLISGRVSAAAGEVNKLGKLDLAVLVDNSSAPDALAALYPQVNIAKGSTANSAMTALILLNLQDQEPLTKTQLAAIFASSNVRVMDVFFSPDSKAQIEQRRLHQAEAMRQDVRDYQQLILPAQPSVSAEDTQSFWLGKVHGFLNRKLENSQRPKENKPSAKADQP